MPEPDWNRYPNFARHEFVCHCGCGKADMDPDFMADLQAIRSMSNFMFKITSGYRCPAHNARVSSTGRAGPHTTGRAVDIAISGGRALTLVMHATGAGFSGLGVKQSGPHSGRFIHIDKVEGATRPAMWSYGTVAVPHEGRVG